MLAPAIRLAAYADPATGALTQSAQAKALVAALCACRRDFIELDFAGVEGVGVEFGERFIRLAEAELADVWLTPSNYSLPCSRLVKPLLNRLRRQREQAWIKGCEWFAAATPRQTSGGQAVEQPTPSN